MNALSRRRRESMNHFSSIAVAIARCCLAMRSGKSMPAAISSSACERNSRASLSARIVESSKNARCDTWSRMLQPWAGVGNAQ